MKKLLFLVGARPQIIKFAALYPYLNNKKHNFLLVHSGQHYDRSLSEIFFGEFKIPSPQYNLNVGSSSHAFQTSDIIMGLEKVVNIERPDFGVVFGDTNTTLAGALFFAKENIPFAHIEAGLRSKNKSMPEEINRVLTDRVASVLFAPTENSAYNLKKEGITKNVYVVGDLHYDLYKRMAERIDTVSVKYKPDNDFLFLTIHREENTKDQVFVIKLLTLLEKHRLLTVFPAHPRTYNLIRDRVHTKYVKILQPLAYLETLWYVKHSSLVLTDSGGLQKEAYFLKKKTVILRNETEWSELLDAGCAKLAGGDPLRILNCVHSFDETCDFKELYGDGRAGEKIIEILTGL